MPIRTAIQNDEDGFKGFLDELLTLNLLEDEALGITTQVISKGIDSLSQKQRQIFDKHVIGELTREKCSNCQSNIPWSEMALAYDNKWNCGYCINHIQKSEND